MNRSRAEAGNAPALALSFAIAFALSLAPVRAQTVGAGGVVQSAPDYWFAGTRLAFERPQQKNGRLAVASDDSGLARFLAKLNATLAYEPGQSYVVLTTGDRRTVSFVIGDRRFSVGGVAQTAGFAPYVAGNAAILPFADIARALYVVPIVDGDMTVLQPQIAALDVRPSGRVTIVTLRGASPLHFKRTSPDGEDRLTLAFSGISSTLERMRQVAGTGLEDVTIATSGSPRNPTTTVTFDAAANATHVLVPSDSPNAIAIAFAPAGVALTGTPVPATGDAMLAAAPLVVRDPRDAAAQPPPSVITGRGVVPAQQVATPSAALAEPQGGPTPTARGLQPATVTGVDADPVDEGLSVAVAVAGPVTYEWHRLSDNRWYVDLKPATLAMDAQDIPVTGPAVLALRVKGFVGPNDRLPTVRIAMTLATPRIVTLTATNGGLAIAVDRLDDLAPARVGIGEIAGGKLVASIVPLPAVTPAAAGDGGGDAPPPAAWKFAPPPASGTNGRLIVLDPGHGGSDTGAMHNGLVEKNLTLDISKRLRTLLIARGWLVKMTRDTDTDVFAPNDSAHDELQARCDVANAAGARLFISVHINSFTSSGLDGTTTYYYKTDSYGLADAVHARLSAALPTKDDGIRKENFYVIHHTTAPAILVETAFLSNPSDAQLLRSDAFLQKVATSIASGVGDYASPAQPLSSNPSASDVSGN